MATLSVVRSLVSLPLNLIGAWLAVRVGRLNIIAVSSVRQPAGRRPPSSSESACHRFWLCVSVDCVIYGHRRAERRDFVAQFLIPLFSLPIAFTSSFTVIVCTRILGSITDGLSRASMGALSADVLPDSANYRHAAHFSARGLHPACTFGAGG